MLINLGRLLMLFVWAFLILNLGTALPAPTQHFRQRGAGFYGVDARHATGATQIDNAERRPANDHRRKNPYFSVWRV
ncbi:putative membrane protein [Salmonella bongori]|nr:putative membrane protein [Salmonella bongori]